MNVITHMPAKLSKACIIFVLPVCQSVAVCIYIHAVQGQICDKNVVMRGCGRLRGSISYFLPTRSSHMNAEASNDVDPKH